MPTINLEMMKQLLQEFSEKQALTTEEIGVIEAELVNLEQRIELCRTKLKNLNADKDKLAMMQERYASGNFSSPRPIEQLSSANMNAAASEKKVEISKSENKESILVQQADQFEPYSTPSVQTAEPDKKKTEKLPKTEQAESGPEVQAPAAEPSNENKDGDTIKSINDALKGLFRK